VQSKRNTRNTYFYHCLPALAATNSATRSINNQLGWREKGISAIAKVFTHEKMT